jgi:magnesium-transporting ATPase (P-type)
MKKQAEFEADGSEEKSHHSVPSPLLLSGTFIQKGQGWFICIVVGDMTCEGQIMAALDEKISEVTALQQKLEEIAIDIGNLGMFVAAAIIHILILRYLCEGLLKRKFDLFGGEETNSDAECSWDGSNDKVKCEGKIGFYI